VDVLVCGAQKPFMTGGAEQHQDNLVTALRAAGHRAEVVRVPVAWEKDRIFEAAMAWRLLPLDADVIIATNFPSYFARHPRKVVWLFHQHRAAYDGADAQADWSDFGTDDTALEAQRLITEWDNVVLGEATRLFSTSGVIADRLARYNGLVATPLYHPPPLADRLHEGDFGDYVLSVARFDSNKRPDLVVDALAQSGGIRAIAAGRGVLQHHVRHRAKAAGVADRLELPGFVDDDTVIELFAGARAVLYAPLDEDYGYTTLQAFLAGKPVVTATDSGGVLEWVEDGVTGLVTDGSPRELGAAFDRLAADPALARRLGSAGRERVRGLAWAPIVDRLLAP